VLPYEPPFDVEIDYGRVNDYRELCLDLVIQGVEDVLSRGSEIESDQPPVDGRKSGGFSFG